MLIQLNGVRVRRVWRPVLLDYQTEYPGACHLRNHPQNHPPDVWTGVVELEFWLSPKAFLKLPAPHSLGNAFKGRGIRGDKRNHGEMLRRAQAETQVSGLIDEDGSVAHERKWSPSENTLSNACRLRVRSLVLVSVIPVGQERLRRQR